MKWGKQKSEIKYTIDPVIMQGVIDYFLTHDDNRAIVIGEKFNIKPGRVNYIMDLYWKKKMRDAGKD